MSSESKKFNDVGEEYVPRTGRPATPVVKDPIARQLDGIAGQLRVLTSAVSAKASEHEAETRAIITERKLELAPTVEAARVTMREMQKVVEEFAEVVSTIRRMNLGEIRKALPLSRWKYADSVVREADALAELFRFVPATLKTFIARAENLTLTDCTSAWRGTKAEIETTLGWQLGIPADVRKRMALLQTAMAEVERFLADAAAKGDAQNTVEIDRPVTRDHVPQQLASKDFDPLNTDPTTREGN